MITLDDVTIAYGTGARAVVAVRRSCEEAFAGLCADHGVPATVLGTTGGTHLTVTGGFSISLDELGAAHRQTLPALFG